MSIKLLAALTNRFYWFFKLLFSFAATYPLEENSINTCMCNTCDCQQHCDSFNNEVCVENATPILYYRIRKMQAFHETHDDKNFAIKVFFSLFSVANVVLNILLCKRKPNYLFQRIENDIMNQ